MRDLDDLLNPVVSRKASAAARTPDFAAVERRGRQRLRRARAAAVGAVVAVAAVVSVVGAQVASYRSDTAPVGTIEWDGPNGELARMAESGNADSGDVIVGTDGSLLTEWGHLGRTDPDAEQSPFVHGFSLAVDGRTYWSPLEYQDIEVSRLTSGGFLVGLTEKNAEPAPLAYYIADASGLRPVELTDDPADLKSGHYDGYAWMYIQPDPPVGIYALDVESATASLVSELPRVIPDNNDPGSQLPQTDDGELWIISDQPDQPAKLLRLASDGRLSTYPLPAGGLRRWPVQESLIGLSASQDGRPILLWADGTLDTSSRPVVPRPLRVSTVTTAGTISTTVLGMAPGEVRASAAALPDGRLLVNNGARLLRSSTDAWQDFETIAAPERMPAKQLRRSVLTGTADSVCLTPSPDFGANRSGSPIYCTVDGDTWDPIDLTP